ncbi:hypothetical protein [Formosa sp. PL04]|uniref:hypothetical protein n=1 Tax=Formosa sp. PL04 TaxID=3081755 RepID=UPI002982357A|nr:hypothetical protein [Formosa sp. PL04]MDW5288382.1 hypothetical protein [Formosa sp. PL04]
MFKKLKSSILCVIVLIIITTLSSCDGRDKSRINPKQILADKGMLTSFSERINYLPENYSETITDTILKTGYNVHIKTYMDMNSNVLKAEIKDSLNIKTFYRNAIADVSVEVNNKNIFNHTISKIFITNNIQGISEALQPYIFKSIWIDDDHVTSEDSVLFNILYSKPENASDNKSFLLTISKEGDYKITETITKI